jgi:hypothetical protein
MISPFFTDLTFAVRVFRAPYFTVASLKLEFTPS